MPTTTITASKDAAIEQTSGDLVDASATTLRYERFGLVDLYQPILYFDLSSIPATAVVTEANLIIYVDDDTGGPRLQPTLITSAWAETNGTDAPATGAAMSSSSILCDTPGSRTRALTVATVQGWVDGDIDNHGVALLAVASNDSGDDCEIRSRSHATSTTRPKLEVTYIDTPGAFTEPDPGDTVTGTSSLAHGASSGADGYQYDVSINNGASWDYSFPDRVAATGDVDWLTIPATTAAIVRSRAKKGSYRSAWVESGVFTVQHDVAHTPATPVSPTGGATVDRTAVEFRWTPNLPTGASNQSKADLRYRLASGGAWTTALNAVTTAKSYNLPSTLAANDWEWQVLTYNQLGTPATGWSASAFFTAGDVPNPPTIISHADDDVIGTEVDALEWTPNVGKTHHQARKVADDGSGDPDTGTVYVDSGEVASTSVTTYALTFPENLRTEHLQVREKVDGLWSDWASVRVDVSYAGPRTPTVAVAAHLDDDGRQVALDVAITNPAPNLLTENQASIETDTTGWAGSGTDATTIARSTAEAADGAASLEMTKITATGTAAAVTPSGLSGIPVVEGDTYTARVEVLADTVARDVRARVTWYDAAGATVGSTISGSWVPGSTLDWVMAHYTGVAPAGAAFARVHGNAGNGAAAINEKHFLDRAAFRRGDDTSWSVGGGAEAVSNELWRREVHTDADGNVTYLPSADGIRIALDVEPDATYTDWMVAHLQPYEYRVKAIGPSRVITWGEWT